MKTKWRDWIECKKYIQSLAFKNPKEFMTWAATSARPKDIPSTPRREYEEWINWTEFLGTQLSYDEAKHIVRKFKFKSCTDYFKNSYLLPRGIPKRPARAYKPKGTWISWDDFLGRR